MVTLSCLLPSWCALTIKTITYRLNNVTADMEAFLSGIMDENALSGDLMDDEYYLFAGEGTPRRLSLLIPLYYWFMMCIPS